MFRTNKIMNQESNRTYLSPRRNTWAPKNFHSIICCLGVWRLSVMVIWVIDLCSQSPKNSNFIHVETMAN